MYQSVCRRSFPGGRCDLYKGIEQFLDTEIVQRFDLQEIRNSCFFILLDLTAPAIWIAPL